MNGVFQPGVFQPGVFQPGGTTRVSTVVLPPSALRPHDSWAEQAGFPAQGGWRGISDWDDE